jgi:hypothetical protein
MGVEPSSTPNRIVVVSNRRGGGGGGRSTNTQNGWSKFAMDHLLWLALTLVASGRMCQMRSARRGASTNF